MTELNDQPTPETWQIDWSKANPKIPTRSKIEVETLYSEAEWLRTAHANSIGKEYSEDYRDGFAAAIGWIEFHAKRASEKEE